MSEFEAGIHATLAVYLAGINGQPKPEIPGMRPDDACKIYTLGVMATAQELDSIEDVSPGMTRFIMAALGADPLGQASLAAYRAHKAAGG